MLLTKPLHIRHISLNGGAHAGSSWREDLIAAAPHFDEMGDADDLEVEAAAR